MSNKIVRYASAVDKWLEDDNLLLIESWARDGYSLHDIAEKIGVSYKTIHQWKSEYKEIADAINNGKELVDYKVESALLKSALGYKTKEVKVTTVMRYGKVVETTKEVTEKEQPPNVPAIQMWLYNRSKNKWKNMSGKTSVFDEMQEDTSIEITVRRADGKSDTGSAGSTEGKENKINKDITLRKRTKSEQEAYDSEVKRKKAEDEKEAREDTKVEYDESDDLDYWPEDWEDEVEGD